MTFNPTKKYENATPSATVIVRNRQKLHFMSDKNSLKTQFYWLITVSQSLRAFFAFISQVFDRKNLQKYLFFIWKAEKLFCKNAGKNCDRFKTLENLINSFESIRLIWKTVMPAKKLIVD